MTERLQIEGTLQVSLIPASSIVMRCSQTNLRQQEGGGVVGGLCTAPGCRQESQKVEAMEPLLRD